ncbi:hypothetical protein B005_3120 [Nocardiopsis alba ATCC BAA-2165]|uniref:Uncharacterized protein n=1 Tax=Nocardiopsis alba (strain ATCC BAA-2165 / BE74) TaxID=1205910 RepID=J7L8J2_NOCAA|nr:hypothetical protein B005_3120 [Nocardiopsis alba ATCC BAA-2165]
MCGPAQGPVWSADPTRDRARNAPRGSGRTVRPVTTTDEYDGKTG